MVTPHVSWSPLLRRVPRLALVVIALVVMARTENFFSAETPGSLLALGSIVGVLALGQAFVLIGGGFDLSQGAMLAFSAAIAAKLATSTGMNPLVIAALTIALGGFLGAINGLFIAGVGTSPFVTTLSTQMIYRGVTFVILGGNVISNVRAFHFLADGPTFGTTLIPNRGFVFLGLAVIGWFVLTKTLFGRHLYAVGGNERAARLSGLNTFGLRVSTYALSGMSSALAALMTVSWVYTSKADTGMGIELDSIAACVVGGISLQGGAGSILGAMLGCLLLQALGLCIRMSNLLPEYFSIATGATLLAFAGVDALARRIS